MSFRSRPAVVYLLLSALLLGGCATGGPRPDFEHIRESAKIAATSKHTWIPLIG